MSDLGRNAGDSAALFEIQGSVSNNSTWNEDIYFLQAGVGMVLTNLSFELQFRDSKCDTSPDLTLSTANGDLTIQNDSNSVASVLRINVPYTTINSFHGEYITDLVSKDASNVLTHWAHGFVTFRDEPIAF